MSKTDPETAAATTKVDPVVITNARDVRDVNIRTILPLACFLLVTLRLFIGWQFLYEGLWKLDAGQSASPWSAEGYLANSYGPFRHTFRQMVDDPNGLLWLNADHVSSRWDEFADRFSSHYNLSDDQKAKLRVLLDGADTYTAPVSKLPPKAEALFNGKDRSGQARNIRNVLSLKDGVLAVKGDEPLLPSEIAWLKGLVPLDRDANGYYNRPGKGDDIARDLKPDRVGASSEEIAWFRAIERLETLQSRNLGYKRKLRAALGGDPDRVGVYGELQRVDGAGVRYIPEMGTIDAEQASEDRVIIRYGEQQIYVDLLNEYEDLLEQNHLDFPQDHADALIGKVRAKRSEVVGPIEQMNDDFIADAKKLLEADQYNVGSLPPASSKLQFASDMATWSLLILGVLLLVGFCTPLAALGGAGMLLSFYLVWPPWPGVPDAPGPEHSFIVNKNLIEVVALLAIAAMPTGRWFGLDGVFAWLYRRVTTKSTV